MEDRILPEEKRRNIPRLILVTPRYNEEELIEKTAAVMAAKLRRLAAEKKITDSSRVLFVNDGSTDGTGRILHDLCGRDPVFSVLSLSGNFGHQSAILAGMMFARDKADVVVTIDADLQQDIEALDEFISKYMDGCEVVYGIRNDRSADSFLKRFTANTYYNLLNALGGKVIKNHADYRLVSAKALEALSGYTEVNLFLRGLIPTMGFRSDVVYFDVKEREAGKSKYSFGKMLSLAMNGLTSFSTRPLRLLGELGFITALIGVIVGINEIIDWSKGENVPGYTTILVALIVFSGVILMSLGVLGGYIAKIYMETKRRPLYIIDNVVWKDDNGNEGGADDRNTCG